MATVYVYGASIDANGVPWLLVEYDGQNGWISSAVAEVTQ